MDMLELLTLAEEEIPTFNGIKYTASTLHEYQSCLDYKGGKFDILYGYDELLLSALAVGAKGAIGSTYTFAAPLYLRVMDFYGMLKVEEARKAHLNLVQMVRMVVKYSPIPAQRAIMKMQGFELGRCRLPLVELDEGEYTSLYHELRSIDFFENLKACIKEKPNAVVKQQQI